MISEKRLIFEDCNFRLIFCNICKLDFKNEQTSLNFNSIFKMENLDIDEERISEQNLLPKIDVLLKYPTIINTQSVDSEFDCEKIIIT